VAHGDHNATGGDAVFSAVCTTPEEWIRDALLREYDLTGELRRLVAERDENFHLTTSEGREFLFKITHPAEDTAITAFHTGAFRHIAARDPALGIPHLIPNRDGNVEFRLEAPDTPPRIARLFTYLPGLPLFKATRTSALRRNLGAALAQLDLALAGYRCTVDGYRLAWDIQHASERRPLLAHIADPGRRKLAAHFLDAFEEFALPHFQHLRRQVIHNDFQPYNVLVKERDPESVSAIIDFGDMVEAPLIDELAVACAYHIDDASEPLLHAAEIAGAYHRVLPLQPAELDILFDLIATRLVLTVSITNWRAERQPENRDYILRNAPAAWRSLERFASLNRTEARRQLAAACS
jgi:Ser/Thr protein kinase RdoA (MazF antagonist)